MLAALPPIAGSTPITRPMNVDHSSRNGPRQDLPQHLGVRHREVDRRHRSASVDPARADPLDLAHDLREGEHADQHRQERHAAFEPADAEREARLAHHRVVAEDGDHAADRAGEQPLGERALDQAGDHRQREDEEREVLPRPELERELARAARWRATRTTAPSSPPKIEAQMPSHSARPGSPFCAIGKPSKVVATAEGLPGNAEQARGDQPAGLAADVDADHARRAPAAARGRR